MEPWLIDKAQVELIFVGERNVEVTEVDEGPAINAHLKMIMREARMCCPMPFEVRMATVKCPFDVLPFDGVADELLLGSLAAEIVDVANQRLLISAPAEECCDVVITEVLIYGGEIRLFEFAPAEQPVDTRLGRAHTVERQFTEIADALGVILFEAL